MKQRFVAAVVGAGILMGVAAPAVSATVYKPGEFCSATKLGKTTKDGKLTLVCKKVPSKGKVYDRWEVK